MNEKQRRILSRCGTDIEGAVNRFGGREEIYACCLKMFLEDRSMQELRTAVENEAWEDARIAAHTLKGIAGNMGFVPLMQAAGQTSALLRSGQQRTMESEAAVLETCYRDITDGILAFFSAADEER